MLIAALHDYGGFLTGLAGILTAGFAILRWMLNRTEKRIKEDQSKQLDLWYHENLQTYMYSAAERAGAKRTRVMDITFTDPVVELRIPVILDEWLAVLPGCYIQGLTFAWNKTSYLLRCDNIARIRSHRHVGTEAVTVVQGRMYDPATEREYFPGEKWTIPAGEPHTVHFESPPEITAHGLFLITVTPPLPDTTQSTLKLDEIGRFA